MNAEDRFRYEDENETFERRMGCLIKFAVGAIIVGTALRVAALLFGA